jgi:hypothetical protein
MTTQRLADGTVHKMPADFGKAIESNATAKSLWTEITPLARNEWICWVTSAKQDVTRKRRIEVGINKMRGACAGRAVGLDARAAEPGPLRALVIVSADERKRGPTRSQSQRSRR